MKKKIDRRYHKKKKCRITITVDQVVRDKLLKKGTNLSGESNKILRKGLGI